MWTIYIHQTEFLNWKCYICRNCVFCVITGLIISISMISRLSTLQQKHKMCTFHHHQCCSCLGFICTSDSPQSVSLHYSVTAKDQHLLLEMLPPPLWTRNWSALSFSFTEQPSWCSLACLVLSQLWMSLSELQEEEDIMRRGVIFMQAPSLPLKSLHFVS